jgi:anti-anti-sigma regulatory factor
MFKISITENDAEQRLVLEGTLIAPWTDELEKAWREAETRRDGRKLLIDLSDVTRISPEGEQVLMLLMQEGAKVACDGIFNRHVLKQLYVRCRAKR